MAGDTLKQYRAKRNFTKTPEPAGDGADPQGSQLAFVIQKHAATRLHYDFRLELGGVMLSWAVPKGPSFDPAEKRMAVRVEDHPIAYNAFEGTIPRGQYGAGTVIVWDRGTWKPEGDPASGLADGKLVFTLSGQKLKGLWELVRIGKPGDRQMAWLLFKKRDGHARPSLDYDVVSALPDSVVTHPLPRAIEVPAAADRPTATPSTGRSLSRLGVKAPLPDKMSPQLATLSAGQPVRGEWAWEIKLDGYRLMARVEEGVPRLFTRGGHDWTAKMPSLVAEIAALGLKASWLDGEIVVLGPTGLPDFNALQKAFDRRASEAIAYFLFDVPFHEGRDVRALPLRVRRQLLQGVLARAQGDRLRLSADFQGDPANILHSACKLGLEGVIAKRLDAPYTSARSDSWLKLKCRQRQEFVVVGFTDRGGEAKAKEIGSLLLAVHAEDGAGLLPVGGVGTGWDASTASQLKARLVAMEVARSPLGTALPAGKGRWSQRPAGSERWVKPSLVAEVSFADWTPDGHIRHATFVGLRTDKAATAIRREQPISVEGIIPIAAVSSAVRVSNPKRVIDPLSGLTKLDLVRYYDSVSDRILPHLRGRPCSLVRGPTGVEGELFFQKHVDKLGFKDIQQLDRSVWPDHEPLLTIQNTEALTSAAQMNVIEFHTWNALASDIDHPDRLVFDLDPGEGVKWKAVTEAAALVRSFLQDLELTSWLKTSGGKGLHLVVPILPDCDWNTCKALSQAVVQHLAKVLPSRFVAKSGPANRVGKIFVDYLRNGHGATTAAAFSARARPGLGVSMPIPWDALDSLKGGAQWTVANAREHLSFQTTDPWADYWSNRQTLAAATRLLGLPPPPAVAAKAPSGRARRRTS